MQRKIFRLFGYLKDNTQTGEIFVTLNSPLYELLLHKTTNKTTTKTTPQNIKSKNKNNLCALSF